MSRKVLIPILAAVAVIALFAGAAFAWDQASSDKVAPGVDVGGVEIGGLTRDEAIAKLKRDYLGELQQPVVASYEGKSWKLTPEQANVSVNVDQSVDAALERSRQENFVVRAYRSISGKPLGASVSTSVSYDRGAVGAFVKRVSKAVDVPARDASLDFGSGSPAPVASKDGKGVKETRLRREVRAALSTPGAPHDIKVRTKQLRPKVTTGELAEKYPTLIVVSRGSFQLTLYKNLKPAKTYTVALGAAGYDTPSGLYAIQDKQVDPVWNVPNSEWAGDLAGQSIPPGPDNPLKARWMGIANGAGIHGTSDIGSLGSAASHGCVRMAEGDVIDLFDRVEVGTPVYIG
ncbi:MAG: L,D-transpeptidase family protein [Solirubrobacterales bacterium]